MELQNPSASRFNVRRRTFSEWRNPQSAIRNPQSGYVLIAVIGALTVMLIIITSLAPSVVQEVKRERETEMLFRGRQIVEAMLRYRLLLARAGGQGLAQPGVVQPGLVVQPGGQVPPQGQTIGSSFGWPRSLEQLADGINLRGSTRRVRLLRPSALKDPMNHDGPWRPVGYNDPALREFLEAYFQTMGQSIATWPPQFRMQYLGTTIDFGDKDKKNQPQQDKSKLRSGLGPAASQEDETHKPVSYIFGVVSESPEQPLRDYYGLQRYDQWIFAYIPELQSVPASSDKQTQMLSREIIYPTDPLALMQIGGGGMGIGIINRPAPASALPPPKGNNPGSQRGSPPGPPKR